MTLKEASSIESVLGYVLKERIGAGGYGEVWKAEAPGGIFKALKIIYGYHDENRAQRELKSLDRIKEVRHAFLLSLERIEVVEGRLVVITELAEKSLKEQFEECRARGFPGIPREELIRYLSDAADVLDFISDSHSLQHLDIKPENLLLVGGHIKVGDFGLVKDVQNTTQSMMAGLTPTYAPPELFDGQPSKSSDQYSLAIVYHEMLTGTRPFPGTTAAQLAAQHLQGRPQLSTLPRGDQPVILRALSKSPSLRYPNCRSLMDDLAGRAPRSVRRSRANRGKSVPATVGENQIDTPCATLVISNSTAVGGPQAHAIRKLAAVADGDQPSALHPTLFLGIGQTATTILRQLRRRFRERFGDDDSLPALRMLCVDTDYRDLSAAISGEGNSTLRHSEIMPVPLRKPEEYRRDATMHLNWLSRRWIYNVPRSLQTEGIRPLGRLAFADHHEKVFEELHRALEQITRPEALAATAETVELDPAESPRVVLVASIAGGVGSGMVLDMAYAVRSALLEGGFSDDNVIGLLVFSTGRTATERDLTVINTYSCLSELHHFSQISGYPGDETCGLPPLLDGDPTFSQTYLVDLGEDLSQDEFEAATGGLAEYLYLNTATRCQRFFETVHECEELSEHMMVRTLGISQTASVVGDVATMPVSIVAHHVVNRWVEPVEQEVHVVEIKQQVDDLVRDGQIAIPTLVQRLATGVDQQIQETPDKWLERTVQPLRDAARTLVVEGKSEALFRSLEAALDQALGISATDGPLTPQLSFREALESVTQDALAEATSRLDNFIWAGMDRPGRRVSQTQCQLSQLLNQLDELVQGATEAHQQTRAELQAIEEIVRASTSLPKDPQALGQHQAVLADAITRYATVRRQELLTSYAKRFYVRLQDQIKDQETVIVEVQQGFAQMANRFQSQFVDEQRDGVLQRQRRTTTGIQLDAPANHR